MSASLDSLDTDSLDTHPKSGACGHLAGWHHRRHTHLTKQSIRAHIYMCADLTGWLVRPDLARTHSDLARPSGAESNNQVRTMEVSSPEYVYIVRRGCGYCPGGGLKLRLCTRRR